VTTVLLCFDVYLCVDCCVRVRVCMCVHLIAVLTLSCCILMRIKFIIMFDAPHARCLIYSAKYRVRPKPIVP